MAFRVFSKLNTFYGNTAQLLAGGTLKFYEAGTTTPQAVYGDEALTVNNGVTVALDSSGRPSADIWGAAGAAYFVELYDADAVKQGEADNVQDPAGPGTNIPTLSGNTGKFLTNNGSVMLWQGIREVPDPTGQSGKVLGNDGSNLAWQSLPAAATPDIVIGANSFRAGVSSDATKFLIQAGSDTAPASGTSTTSKNITFPTPYASLLHVSITRTTASASASMGVTEAVTGYSPGAASTGVTARFDSADDGGESNWQIVNTVPFTWIAFGFVEVP